uniref:NADH-ubiquinone oxidoreductase chain 2 n=1 Tax=Stilicoderus aquilinus TaxID=2994888 RepID=A0A9E8G172_9COLE|nr:NADH dehydrogenase subunit 2 [Stilicoderus aquilinus]UZN43804.1 NADH dehydrogenase subunit 2 [Stilicoderus aquilinus]
MIFYKILFSFCLMIGSLISITSNTWMGMWMGLEINLLSIIPLMNNKKNVYASEASMKYFITQALASTILLISIILMSKIYSLMWLNNYLMISFNTALLTKMGTAPFHFWFPEVMEGLSWMNCFILLTWQKIAPMILLMYNLSQPILFSFVIIMSMLISGVMGLNQISLRKIMAYSSINHIGWMISSMMFMNSIWMYYFLIYSIISMNLIVMFKMFNIFFIKQLIALNFNFINKFLFIFNLISLGGLPPFLGFMPKWLTIQTLINSNQYLLSIVMIMLTLLTLFYYLRMSYSTLMFNSSELNFTLKPKFNSFMPMTLNLLSISGLIICTSLFNLL